MTQRSLLMGLPIALMVFTLLWKLIHLDRGEATRPSGRAVALGAGILTGSLPLVHAHSFIVVMGTAFLLGLLFRQWREDRWRWWAIYVVAALAVALPQAWWSTRDSVASAGTFFGLEFGWDHARRTSLWFWFINTGLFIPLAALAVVWRDRTRLATRSLLLFTAAFARLVHGPERGEAGAMDLGQHQGPVLLVRGVRAARGAPDLAAAPVTSRPSGPPGAAALVVLTLAGGLDVWRAVSGQTEYGEFDRDGIAFAALDPGRRRRRTRWSSTPRPGTRRSS